MKNNVVLIGMPGAGKSTIGVVLAKVLGYKFVDSDLVIQEKTHKLLKDIIEEEGTDGFKKVENKVNAELEAERSVIATGGSVVYGQEAMEHLRNIGVVIYIRVPYEEINRRISNLKGRGVVMEEDQTLLDIFNERNGLYEKYADVIIDISNIGIEESVCKILQSYIAFSKNNC